MDLDTFMGKLILILSINVPINLKLAVLYPLDIAKDTPLLIGSDAPRDKNGHMQTTWRTSDRARTLIWMNLDEFGGKRRYISAL